MYGGMLRSFIRSTMAFTWSLPMPTALVSVAVPLVVSATLSVAVPLVGTTRSGVKSNCACEAMSNAFFASFLSTLSITSVTLCSDRSSSLPVYGTELPCSVIVSVPCVIVKLVSGIVLVSMIAAPWLATSE